MDKNVIILVVLVLLYAGSQFIADKIQISDCQEQLMVLNGKGNLNIDRCCTCVLDQVKTSEFKILEEQFKLNGISALVKVDDPLLDVFDKSWTACYKNESQNVLSFSTFQIDSLTTLCKEEYAMTGLEKEVDIGKYCSCSVDAMKENLSVRELLRNEFNFSDNQKISKNCMSQNKIAIDTIQ